MANKAISELPQAQNVNNQDLFVLEQSGIAKKLTAETFITEQGIIDALAEALDGHGGISSVTLSSVSGRIRTYLITFTDGSATTFQVLDGTTITSIQKTSTAGLVDTYTVYMSDGTTSFFNVTNGEGVSTLIRPACSAFMDKLTAVKTYPVNNGRQISVNKNHVTVTRTGSGTTYGTLSLTGSGTTFVSGSISAAGLQTLYNAGEYIPRDNIIYNHASYPWKWYFSYSVSRPAEGGDSASIYLAAYDTVNVSYRFLVSSTMSATFPHNESSSSFLIDFSSLTADEVVIVLFYRRGIATDFRGVVMELDWNIESGRWTDTFANQDSIAYVEKTSTASRAYSVNNYFINSEGVLCRITASVASGGTLTAGTNYTVVTGGLANDLYSLLS